MRQFSFFLLIAFLLFPNINSEACLGRILNIGIVSSSSEKLLAELISVLINERTGTTVNIKVFEKRQEIYDAVKSKEINVVIENIDHAVKILNITKSEDKKKNYEIAKREYRRQMGMLLLKPFGYISDENNKGQYYYAALIPEDLLVDFPALPRVINKLRGITGDRNFSKVVQSVKSGRKIIRVARDFLKQKKLI